MLQQNALVCHDMHTNTIMHIQVTMNSLLTTTNYLSWEHYSKKLGYL